MPVSIVQGKLGTGKGKYGVTKIRDALVQGKRVATNCDLFLEHLLPANSRMTALRLPDKPTPEDMALIGQGYEGKIDRNKDGILVLDELGSWLNARSFQDKNRSGFLDWLIHARKHRWTTYLIAQDVEMIDKQIRVSVCEYQIKCINLENLKIPVIGHLLGPFGKLPRMHVAQISLTDVPGVQVDRDFYRADDIQNGYDTEQVFRNWARNPSDMGFATEEMAGPFSYLSPWHIKGRHEVQTIKPKTWLQKMFKATQRPDLKPKHPLIERVAKLPKDKAWHFARLLNLQGQI